MSAIEIIFLVLVAAVAIRIAWPVISAIIGVVVFLLLAAAVLILGVIAACVTMTIVGVLMAFEAIRDIAWKLGRRVA